MKTLLTENVSKVFILSIVSIKGVFIMQTRKVYLYVFDTMADWEIGYLMAELNTGRYFKRD